jgi:hypothetical protein
MSAQMSTASRRIHRVVPRNMPGIMRPMPPFIIFNCFLFCVCSFHGSAHVLPPLGFSLLSRASYDHCHNGISGSREFREHLQGEGYLSLLISYTGDISTLSGVEAVRLPSTQKSRSDHRRSI